MAHVLGILLFLGIIFLTLYITYWAAQRVRSTSEFYAAGRSLTSWQNGLAIAGDYLSAASFLGIAGLVALHGYDGFLYAIGFLMGYVVVLYLVAEPLRNSGKFTVADMLAFRLNARPVRSAAALVTITISTFYLVAQMVGAGSIIQLLIGIPYEWAVFIVGVLMVLYVVFGGMLATSWVQIVKAVLLLTGTILLVLFVGFAFRFNPSELFRQVAEQYGPQYLNPGVLYKNPIDLLSLGLALVLGTAGLPHILIRFYTVPTAQDARKSVLWAMGVIGVFYLLITYVGFGAMVLVGPEQIKAADKGGNMAAPLLALVLGGGQGSFAGELFMSAIAAVSFATIVAVVAGLVIAASGAFAHDIYTNVIRGGKVDERKQFLAARYTALAIGGLSILIGIAAKGQNVAHLVGLAFAVAASANLPAILLSLYWKRFNTAGALAGMLAGLATALGLVLVGPNVMGKGALFPLSNPAIVSIPVGFLASVLVSLATRPETEYSARYDELVFRANTGVGAE